MFRRSSGITIDLSLLKKSNKIQTSINIITIKFYYSLAPLRKMMDSVAKQAFKFRIFAPQLQFENMARVSCFVSRKISGNRMMQCLVRKLALEKILISICLWFSWPLNFYMPWRCHAVISLVLVILTPMSSLKSLFLDFFLPNNLTEKRTVLQ